MGTYWEMFSIIIFSGGGFRDSLADMAEELCPSSTDAPLPLSFFVRSPNQVSACNVVTFVYVDLYSPNAVAVKHLVENIGRSPFCCFSPLLYPISLILINPLKHASLLPYMYMYSICCIKLPSSISFLIDPIAHPL